MFIVADLVYLTKSLQKSTPMLLHVTFLLTTYMNVYVTQLENNILLNDFALVIDKGHSDDSNIVVFTCHTGWSHTFVEIDHEIISTAILLPSAESIKKGCLSVTSEIMCTTG